MKIAPLHDWNLTPSQAIQLQKQLAHEVVAEDRFDAPVKTVAGIDLGYDAKNDTSRAAVVVLSFPELGLIEKSEAILPIQFPYVPGLLSFRETPVAIKALEKLTVAPDLILCDGQGLAHPRRFGIACHIGLIVDVPTVGVAKSLLVESLKISMRLAEAPRRSFIEANKSALHCEPKTRFSRFSFQSVIALA